MEPLTDHSLHGCGTTGHTMEMLCGYTSEYEKLVVPTGREVMVCPVCELERWTLTWLNGVLTDATLIQRAPQAANARHSLDMAWMIHRSNVVFSRPLLLELMDGSKLTGVCGLIRRYKGRAVRPKTVPSKFPGLGVEIQTDLGAVEFKLTEVLQIGPLPQ